MAHYIIPLVITHAIAFVAGRSSHRETVRRAAERTAGKR